MNLGERIKEQRKLQGFTQSQLALYCNVSQQTVAAWEGNKKKPGLTHLTKLGVALGVTLDYLVKGERHTPYSSI